MNRTLIWAKQYQAEPRVLMETENIFQTYKAKKRWFDRDYIKIGGIKTLSWTEKNYWATTRRFWKILIYSNKFLIQFNNLNLLNIL